MRGTSTGRRPGHASAPPEAAAPPRAALRASLPAVASAVTHAFTALALAPALLPRARAARSLLLGVASALVADVDVWGWWLGVPYGHPLGHRGLTHAPAFAAAWSVLLVWLLRRGAARSDGRWRLYCYFFLCAASHGVLDAMADGGLGVAFLAPFHQGRWFLPWRPLAVPPLGVGRFFSARGWEVLRTELVWVWAPLGAFALVAWLARCRRAAAAP